MTLTDVQHAVLDDNIDHVIACYLNTDDCRRVYSWIDDNIMQLRAWALYAITRINSLSPYRTASLVENFHSKYDKFIFEAYKEVDDRFPIERSISVKEVIRNRIFNEIGNYDIYDIIADISKRLAMIERLSVRSFKYLKDSCVLNGYVVDNYSDFLDRYVEIIDNGIVRDRVDLEPLDIVFEKILRRVTMIACIVDEEMFNGHRK